MRHLDETAAALTSPASVPVFEELNDAGMLLCAYQFAMRPIQIAMLNMRNVRIWHEAADGLPTVHLTFHMAKQRSDSKRRPLTRRVKREWAPLFVALNTWRQADGAAGSARFFNVQSNYEAGARIAALVRKLIGSDDLGTATDLRHTAAQRLVDAGASHEELAEFMGHSNIQTGLVYYATSATHAERVNRALGASDTYLRVGELEDYIRSTTPTKVSDTAPLPLADGLVQPWELLFLQPKRSLAEERNDGLCDITRYMAVNRPDPSFIGYALGDAKELPSLFEKYGETAEDRALKIESHMLRHLQNTELFRLGVADTIISKRFNRRSVAQSYEYDHRSLAEELDQIEIPRDIEIMLGEKASTVAKLIKGGRASGPIVEAFRRIQATEGDTAAYEYLRVEADGFHATPYGHCLSSFTVDPCPNHLECFNDCRHLSATDLPENRQNLIRLEGKFKIAVEEIKSRPSTSIGWKNQLEHAEQRLVGVRTLLATPAGERPFPDGRDLSLLPQRGVLDD